MHLELPKLRKLAVILSCAVFSLSLLLPQTVRALNPYDYYDWGPYYHTRLDNNVLGATITHAEALPTPEIPNDINVPTPSGIAPNSPFYFLDTTFETIQEAITLDPIARAELKLQHANERLHEAYVMMQQGEVESARRASIAYYDDIQSVSDEVARLADAGESIESLAAQVEQDVTEHAVLAASLTTTADPAGIDTLRTLTDAAELGMDTAADALDRPAVPPDLAESIDELRQQGLLTSEDASVIIGVESRVELRDTLERLTRAGEFPPAELYRVSEATSELYPDYYTQELDNLRFVELRRYQTMSPPSGELLEEIKAWQKTRSPDEPTPPEYEPFLYFTRIENLTQSIDLSNYSDENVRELTATYPTFVTENPTYSTPSAVPETAPLRQDAEEQATPAASPIPETPPLPEGTAGAIPGAVPSAGEGSTPSAPTPAATPGLTGEAATPSAIPYIGQPTGLLPNNPLYFTKRWVENLQTTFTFDEESRLERQLDLAEERLREAYAMADQRQALDDEGAVDAIDQEIATAIETYADMMADVAPMLDAIDAPPVRQEELASRIEDAASRHSLLFELNVMPPIPEVAPALETALASTHIAMDEAADDLGRPVLPPALNDRLQDLKTQGILMPEEVDRLVASGSRAALREELERLEEEGVFPTHDLKKLDERQQELYPKDYNQITEVQKAEELLELRARQRDLTQAGQQVRQAALQSQRVNTLLQNFHPDYLRPEDFVGRPELFERYEALATISAETTPPSEEASPAATPAPTATPEPAGEASPAATPAPTPLPPPPTDEPLPAPEYDGPLPGDAFYGLARFGENVQNLIAFTPEARAQRRLESADRRLGEAYALYERGDFEHYQETIAEYTDTMQQAFNTLADADPQGDTRQELAQALEERAIDHNIALQQLSILAPPETAAPVMAAIATTTQALDRAADLQGEPAFPPEIQAALEALPPEVMTDAARSEVLDEVSSRIEARAEIASLIAQGVLPADAADELDMVREEESGAALQALRELRRLEEIDTLAKQRDELLDKATQNAEIAQEISRFQEEFATASATTTPVIDPEVRPYLNITRIDELSATLRPDLIDVEDFVHREDIVTAVATLRHEIRPSQEDLARLASFRKEFPGVLPPPELQRIESLVYSIGPRDPRTRCFLPSPPFAPGTPCPAATELSIDSLVGGPPPGTTAPTPTTAVRPYGVGPTPLGPGECPAGFFWMYDNGGWCMESGAAYGSAATDATNEARSFFDELSSFGFTQVFGDDYIPGIGRVAGYTNPWDVPYDPYEDQYRNAPEPEDPDTQTCPEGYFWFMDYHGGWCKPTNTYYPVIDSWDRPVCGPSQYWDGPTQRCVEGNDPYSCGPGYYRPYPGAPCTPEMWIGPPPPLGGTTDCPNGEVFDGFTCIPEVTEQTCRSAGDAGECWCPPGYYVNSDGQCTVSIGPEPDLGGGGRNRGGQECGPDYFWNGSYCEYRNNYCEPPDRSAPNDGCGGENWYFDYGRCSCRNVNDDKSCTPEAIGGCSGNTYFDTYTCSCQPTDTPPPFPAPLPASRPFPEPITCSAEPPPEGCGGPNWYWDNYTCSCRNTYDQPTTPPGGGPTCPAPAGCSGANWYWDTATCTCRNVWDTPSPPPGTPGGIGPCTPPFAGCGDNSFWDSYTCSCISMPGPGGPPTPGGPGCANVSPASCGPDFYWDSFACTCMPTTPTPSYPGPYPPYPGGGGGPCVTPSGGCGLYSYWDNYSCTCVPTGGPSTPYPPYPATPCTEPYGGCGGPNWYWDSASCSCRNISDSTPYPGSSCTWKDCGPYSYWDSGSCSCRSMNDPYTPGPYTPCTNSTSCGPGYYWNSESCSCMPSTYTPPSYPGSSPPPATCTWQDCPGGWFDYGTCSCQYSSGGTGTSGSGPCTDPGCPSGGIWDSTTCSCYHPPSDSGSSSPAPTSCTDPGCGGGMHWDAGACACVPDSSPPTDTSSSQPSTESSPPPEDSSSPPADSSPPPSSSCSPPSEGCGPNTSWHEDTCSCR